MPMRITEAEQIVRDRLGTDYGVVKLSQYWIVWRKDGKGSRTQSTSLDKAIREQQRPNLKSVPTYQSDALGAVTIPEDDQ